MLKGLDNQPFMHKKSIIFTTNKKKIFFFVSGKKSTVEKKSQMFLDSYDCANNLKGLTTYGR